MGRVIGIDLGTTNSLAAYMEGGQPTIIPDLDGHRLVPSMITFTPNGIAVGERAKRLRAENVGNTVYSVKRLMGKGIEEVRAELAMAPFKISDQSKEVIRITIDQHDYTPPELSAMVLKQLKTQAEKFFGEPVGQAVITVPAYFNDSQRQATKDAGQIAGFEVLRILNEPTAAALAYGLDKKRQGIIAVYDLGGGTFDISILKLNNGIFEVLATNGITHLGGDDFDRAMLEVILQEMEGRYKSGIRQNPKLIEQIRIAAEKAKCALSSQAQTELVIAMGDGEKHYRRTLTRNELEDLIRDLINKTMAPCQQALADAKLTPDRIDEVILVGGSTRIPLVQETVKALFKKQPKCELNPDEVVALGAAVQAHILMGEIQDMLLLDVTPLSLGIETFGGIMSKLIDRNSKVPTSAKETFTTFVDGQTAVDIHVLQGERELAKDNQSLARFALKGIPPMPASIPRIEVTFHLDANGILNVSAKELRTGQEQSIEVKPTYGLSKTEVERMIKDSMVHAKSDIEARQLVEARNEAEVIIRATEKALRAYAILIQKEEVGKITSALERLKTILKGEDRHRLRQEIQEVEALTRPLAESIMQKTVKEDLEGKKLSDLL
jgi:molecular chaperone DnaK